MNLLTLLLHLHRHICSEVVVQYEAKSPDNIHFILHFAAVEAHNLLSVPQHALDLLRLLHHVCTLGSKSQPRLVIELKEIGGVSEMARSDLSNWIIHGLLLDLIVSTKRWRDVVLAPIVKCEFERRQTSNVCLGADSYLSEQTAGYRFVCCVEEGLSGNDPRELVEVFRVHVIRKQRQAELLH